jgi:beta-glucanase (GH16 family)
MRLPARGGGDDRKVDLWHLVWADEFDGSAGARPDPAVWRAETGGHGWGNNELQGYTADPENASVDGTGSLAIVARRCGGSYTSARLMTKGLFTVRYGVVEARIRWPGGRGVWPCFWMLGQDIDAVGWPRCGEIDIAECFGTGEQQVRGTVHGPGYSGDGGVSGACSLEGDGFHLYAVHWTPDRIIWYADGQPYHVLTRKDLPGPWVFDHDFYLLLNVAVGGRYSVTPPEDERFPRTMLVDYVRVYQRSP